MLTLRQIERRGFELVASSILRFVPLLRWKLGDREVTLPFHEDTGPGKIYVFSTSAEVPKTRFRWLLKVVTSGNALLRVDGASWAGIDEAHTYVPVEPGRHEFELRLSPRSLFGFHRWSVNFAYAALVEIAWSVYSLGAKILTLVEFLENLPPDSDLRSELHNLLSRVLLKTRIVPSLTQITAAMMLLYEGGVGFAIRRDIRRAPQPLLFLAGVYGVGVLKGALKDMEVVTPIEQVLEEARRIERELEKGLEDLRKKFPKIGEVCVFGHSHIDAAWLWPYAETREKILRTFSTIVRLLNEYRRPVYVQSSAQYYEWLEELDPELFKKVSRLVSEGRWLPVGGMWVESDTNLVDGESLARQFLYGQRYFLSRFGKIAKIGWLPDTFGFAASLPQIMRKSGIEVFATHKVMWNDTNPFPYHSFVWVGVDGTEIPVQVIINGYNEPATPASIYTQWKRYKNKSEVPVTIYAYGYGDGGGGPTLEMMEYLELMDELPGLPRLVMPREDEYVEKVKKYVNSMPRWRDELYVEIHRGVYTTNLKIKELMARAEALLREAETWSALAKVLGIGEGAQERLDKLWKRVLLHQFHDVLPGSSIKDVYDDAYQDLEEVLRETSDIIESTLRKFVKEKEGAFTVANPLPWSRSQVVVVEGVEGVLGTGSKPVECQEVDGKKLFLVEAPPLGFKTYEVMRDACRAEPGVVVKRSGRGLVLENECVRLEIDEDGNIASLYLKSVGKELLAAPSNKLVAHVDKPGVWDAWDVERDIIVQGEELETVERPKVVIEGPLLSCVETVKKFRYSTARQRLCLYKNSPLIEVRTIFDWRDKNVLIKSWFWPSFHYSFVTYDIPYGVLDRSARANTSWEQAKFEVPALRWADASDGHVGLGIIAPSRHGYAALEDRIGLSLLKSPVFPNPWSDVGILETVYYIYPHPGTYADAEIYLRAYEVMHPIKVLRGTPALTSPTMLEVSPPSIVGAFKQAFDGDGYVLRLFNPLRRSISVKVKLGFLPKKVVETDIIEYSTVKELRVDGNEFLVEMSPLEIKTLKILPSG